MAIDGQHPAEAADQAAHSHGVADHAGQALGRQRQGAGQLGPVPVAAPDGHGGQDRARRSAPDTASQMAVGDDGVGAGREVRTVLFGGPDRQQRDLVGWRLEQCSRSRARPARPSAPARLRRRQGIAGPQNIVR